ncbi:MAG: hypothetical protein WCD88_06570, partial [Desulfobacterales bacterium]
GPPNAQSDQSQCRRNRPTDQRFHKNPPHFWCSRQIWLLFLSRHSNTADTAGQIKTFGGKRFFPPIEDNTP